jgi:hypothetical protein
MSQIGFLGSTQLPPQVTNRANRNAFLGTPLSPDINPTDVSYLVFRPGQNNLLNGGGIAPASSDAAPVPSTPQTATFSAWWIVALIVLLFLIF